MKHSLPAHIAFGQRLAANAKITITHNLSNSCGPSLTVNALCSLAGTCLENVLGEQALSYASLGGSQYLRSLIADFHQGYNAHKTQLCADDVLTFCGAQEALSAIYQAVLLAETKDKQADIEIVVITPCYPLLVVMAEEMGVKVRCLALKPEQGWQINQRNLLALVNEKTRLIVVNSPHNPSGSVIERQLADEILRVAKQFNCYLLADDVSQASNYRHLDLAHRYLDYDRTIVVSVLSKSFGLAGLRIGWAVSKNRALLKNLLAIKTQSSICTSVVDERLAELALANNELIIKNNNAVIAKNIKLFQQFIDTHSQYFSWHPPQAGILALVKCHTHQPMLEWAEQLAMQSGIMVYPASLFGLKGSYFRLGLGVNDFSTMLELLKCFLKKH